LGNLTALVIIPAPPPMPHDKDRDMVAGEACEIGEDAVEHRRSCQRDAALLLELASKRGLDGLVPFHAAAGEEPARPITMTHQKHPILGIEHDTLAADRDPSAKSREGPKDRG